jgi:outer membrane protein TolC
VTVKGIWRSFLVGALGLGLWLGPARAEEFRKLETNLLDLPTAYQLALDNNPTLRQALANLDLADLRIQAAYNELNPTLELSLSELYVSQLRRSISERDAEVTLSIPIYNFGQVHWNAKSAKFSRNQAGQDLRTAIASMIQQVAQDFVQASLNETLVEISQLMVQDRQVYYQQANDLFEAGEIAEFETIQAESNVLAAQENVASTQQVAATSLAQLLMNLGVRPDTQLQLAALPPLEPPPDSIEEGMARALELRPEVQSLRWQVEAQEALAVAYSRQNTPQVSVYTTYDGLNEGSNYDPTWEAGLQVTWELCDGGVARNARKQAQVQAEILRGQLGQQERQVALDVATAYAQLRQLWPQIELARRSQEKAQQTLEIAQLRFKAGLSSGVELLSAQDTLNSARTATAQAEASYRLAQINWRRAISADAPVDLPAEWVRSWQPLPGTEEIPKTKQERKAR